MKQFRLYFQLLGLALLGLFIFLLAQNMDGTFKKMVETQMKYQLLVIAGFVCFWLGPIFDWIRAGMNVNVKKIRSAILDEIFPSFGRQIPTWAQLLRLIGVGLFGYFIFTALKVVNEELEISFENFWIIILGFTIFIGLPFLFKKKDIA